MNDKCNEKLYVKPEEVCNFKALSQLNTKRSDNKYINDNNNIFKDELKNDIIELNYPFRNSSNNEFTYDESELKKNNKKFLCYPTDITKKEYYLNCVLETGNPLFTFKDGICMVHPDLNLNNNRLIKGDDGFIYVNNVKDEQGNFKYYKKKNTAYCEDKWFDWIITPNYHFGNRYYRDSGVYSKEDVKKCYKPCGMGRLPYLNDNNEYICVSKDVVYDGIYRNKLDYSPIALINLIGNNNENLQKLYDNLYNYKIDKIDKTNYMINDKITIIKDVNEAIDEIKKVLNTIVTDNNIDIPSYSMEKNHLTYKHPNFNENDKTLLTYIGLEKNDVIANDIILIHTAYLALGYYNFLKSIMNVPDNFKEEGKIIVEKFNKNKFNIMNVLEGLDIISYDTNLINNYYGSIKNLFNKFNEIITDKKTQMSIIKLDDDLKNQIIIKVIELSLQFINDNINNIDIKIKIKAVENIKENLSNELTKNAENILLIDSTNIKNEIIKQIKLLSTSNPLSETNLPTYEKLKQEIEDVIINYAKNNPFKILNKNGLDKLFNNKDINLIKIINRDLTNKKRQRLANILYKAINICYDNKTDFSKNIILRTQEAINRTTNISDNYSDVLTLSNKNELYNGFNIFFYNYDQLKNIKEKIDIPETSSFFLDNFKKNYDDNFIFFTQEASELIKYNRCNAGSYLKNNNCVRCSSNCNNTTVCNNDNDCKIYCKKECDEFKTIEANKDSRCGRRVNHEEDKMNTNEIVDNVKTPIDDENYIPNFSYIFKTSIKIFFALIIVFVAYIFYKLFGETILTLINMIYYPFIQFIRRIWYGKDDIKYAENNYDIIKKKYDEISRSLIKSNALKGH